MRVHAWTYSSCNVSVEVHNVSYSAQDPSVVFGGATSTPHAPCAQVSFDDADSFPGELHVAPFVEFDLDAPIGPYLQVLLTYLPYDGGPMEFAISVDLIGRGAPRHFDPLLDSGAAYLPGGYSDLSDPDVWSASRGTDVTAVDDPARTEFAGCPRFDYSTAAGEVHLANGHALSSWGGSPSGNRQFVARVDLADVSTSDPTSVWLNCAAISDAGSFMGLHFRKSGSSYYAYYYEWDTQARVAEVDITPLLVNGYGSLVVQGRRQGNLLSIKVGSSAWVHGATTIGALASTAGTLRIGYRSDMTVRAVFAFSHALQDHETDQIADWAARL